MREILHHYAEAFVETEAVSSLSSARLRQLRQSRRTTAHSTGPRVSLANRGPLLKTDPNGDTAPNHRLVSRSGVFAPFVFVNSLPVKLLSDNGSQLASHFSIAVCEMLRVKNRLITSYYLQTNGQKER